MVPALTEHDDCVAIIAKQYRIELHAAGIVLQHDPDGSVAPGHLLWMLGMLINDHTMSLTKRHRWLGFIQACLTKDNMIECVIAVMSGRNGIMVPALTEHEDCVAIVAKRYRAIFHCTGITLKSRFKPENLLSILDRLIIDPAMSLTKRHHWLGFIQGCLIKDDVLNLQDERNLTRNVFAGD